MRPDAKKIRKLRIHALTRRGKWCRESGKTMLCSGMLFCGSLRRVVF
jgi:hypothetical protein